MSQLPPGFVIDPAPQAPAQAAPRSIPGTGPKPAPAPTTYRTLTRGEVAAQQLNPGHAYQQSSDGKIDDLGELPESALPAAERDPERATQIRTILGNIKNIRGMSDDTLAVGNMSGRVGDVPLIGGWLGQNRANVEGALQMVQGDLVQQQIARLNAASGGKGVASLANSETEAARMAASIANLDPNQDLPNFTSGLDRAEQYYVRALAREMGIDPNDPALMEKLGLAKPAETQNPGAPPAAEDDGLSGVVSDDTRSPYDPGGPLNPGTPNQSGIGFWGKQGTALQQSLAGLAQGAGGLLDVPLQAERGINYAIGQGGGALADLVGAPGAADWWRQGADRADTSLSRASATDAIEQLVPTQEGYGGARFLSQLVGSMAVPFGPKAAPRINAPSLTSTAGRGAAREVIAAGDQAGVRVMTSDVRPPSTFTGKTLRSIGERIPYAGTGGPRAAQQAERVQAVRDLARDYGVNADENALVAVAEDLSATRGALVQGLTRAKNAVIESVRGDFTAPRTLVAIGQQVRALARIDAEKFAPVIAELQRFGNNIISGKTLQEIEGNRKLLGDLFADPSLAAIRGDGQKAINAIYAPLRDDMGAFIEANAGGAARNQWAQANDRLAAMAGELDNRAFSNVLRDAEATPENVANLLFSKKPSDVRRLVGNLSPDGRARAQAAIIGRAFEKAGGAGDELSPDKFANAVRDLGSQIGVVFSGDDLARVQGLERLLRSTKQAGVASAAPPTGVQNTQLIGAALAGASGPISIPLLGTAGGLARIYESAPVRNLLVGLSRTQPGSRAEGKLLERILKVATSQMEIRGGAANDALGRSPGQLAAQEQPNN